MTGVPTRFPPLCRFDEAKGARILYREVLKKGLVEPTFLLLIFGMSCAKEDGR